MISKDSFIDKGTSESSTCVKFTLGNVLKLSNRVSPLNLMIPLLKSSYPSTCISRLSPTIPSKSLRVSYMKKKVVLLNNSIGHFFAPIDGRNLKRFFKGKEIF